MTIQPGCDQRSDDPLLADGTAFDKASHKEQQKDDGAKAKLVTGKVGGERAQSNVGTAC